MVALPSILLLSIAGGFVCWMKKREKTSRQAELAATGWSHAFVAQEQQQQQQQQQQQTMETKATHQQHNNINHPAAASLPPTDLEKNTLTFTYQYLWIHSVLEEAKRSTQSGLASFGSTFLYFLSICANDAWCNNLPLLGCEIVYIASPFLLWTTSTEVAFMFRS